MLELNLINPGIIILVLAKVRQEAILLIRTKKQDCRIFEDFAFCLIDIVARNLPYSMACKFICYSFLGERTGKADGYFAICFSFPFFD